MSVNLVVLDGLVKDTALRYDSAGKAEFRFTLAQTTNGPEGQTWVSYWPCCAVATAAERLAAELENGQYVVITSAKLAYRKRTLKGGEQSRIEVMVWQADRLSTPPITHEPEAAYATEGTLAAELAETPAPKGKPRYPKHLQQPWHPEHAN